MQIRVPDDIPKGLNVIETMRAETGTIPLWSLHRERLIRDCAAVGFPLDLEGVERRLADLPAASVLRVRLTVDGTGRIALTHQPQPPNPARWRVTLSSVRLDSDDPWLRIKTSHRPAYDAARLALPEGVDETILLNQRGEVCEGTITNLFLLRGEEWLTPPAESGLLPGVLRSSLLHAGHLREAVLMPGDLLEGQIFMGNALRGLIPAEPIPACMWNHLQE